MHLETAALKARRRVTAFVDAMLKLPAAEAAISMSRGQVNGDFRPLSFGPAIDASATLAKAGAPWRRGSRICGKPFNLNSLRFGRLICTSRGAFVIKNGFLICGALAALLALLAACMQEPSNPAQAQWLSTFRVCQPGFQAESSPIGTGGYSCIPNHP